MIVNSTDLKNNLGKYLRQCAKEEIIITSNGRKIAVLKSYEEAKVIYDSLFENDSVSEKQAEAFNVEQKDFLAFNEDTQKRYEYIDQVCASAGSITL